MQWKCKPDLSLNFYFQTWATQESSTNYSILLIAFFPREVI